MRKWMRPSAPRRARRLIASRCGVESSIRATVVSDGAPARARGQRYVVGRKSESIVLFVRETRLAVRDNAAPSKLDNHENEPEAIFVRTRARRRRAARRL